MGGTFVMSAIAVIVVLFRRPSQGPVQYMPVDSTEQMFKEQPNIPTNHATISPPQKNDTATQRTGPSSDLIGVSHEGKEWLEWPSGSDNHWFRDVGFGGEWQRYEP